MAQAPRVAVIAGPTGASLTSGPHAALGLASALAGTSEATSDFLQEFGRQRRANVEAQAEADALATSGTAFKEAVKSGKLERTQNPWYIQSYERKGAQVRAQGELTELVTEAQTWGERSDPAAFAARLQAEVGKRGQAYKGPNQLQGFDSAAAPILQQTLAANTAYNVRRINEEHAQDVSTLATEAILKVSAANGGKPTAAQVWEALAPAKKEWLDTGGTEAQWNNLTINSVIAASANSADASLLNVLQDDRGGEGALANIAGPDGTPVAQTIMSARYRIEQEAATRGMAEIRAKQNAAKAEGMKAVDELQTTFGYDFLRGEISQGEVLKALEAKGYSPQAAAYAINVLAGQASDVTSLARSLADSNPETLDLYRRANTEGMSSSLYAEIEAKVISGEMDVPEAKSVMAAAVARTNHFEAEARADSRSNRSDARAAATASKQQSLMGAFNVKQATDQALGASSVALQGLGDRSLLDPATRKRVTTGAQDAANAALARNPGDYGGAAEASKQYLNRYVTDRIARRPRQGGGGRGKPAGAVGGNPRDRK
jgi:hypothetical protein